MPSKFLSSTYFNSFLVLASGTALAQALPILASPVLTRLYSPSDFGDLSFFLAIVSSLGMAVCGRYDLAVLLPKKNSRALHLFCLSIWFGLIFFSIVLCITVILQNYLYKYVEFPELGGFLYLIPFVLLLTGIRTALGYWGNRQGDYKSLTKAQLIQAVVVTAGGLTFGSFGGSFASLLTSYIVGLLSGGIFLWCIYSNNFILYFFKNIKFKIALAIRFKSFPLYSASSAILDGVTMNLPVFFLAYYFNTEILGYYSLVLRVANSPLSFISSSVSQVHLKKMIDLLHEDGDVLRYFLKLSLFLGGIALLPMIIIMPFAPWVFMNLFGSEWREAGVFLQILMPSLAVRFIASTVSGSIETSNNSHWGAGWKVLALIVTSAVFFIFGSKGDVYILLIALSVSDVFLYILYYLISLYTSLNPRIRKL